MDLARVRELIEILEASSISEIEIEEDGRRVRLAKRPPPREEVAAPAYGRGAEQGAPVGHHLRATEHEGPQSALELENGMTTIDSPMVGVFYAGPAPGKPPFVSAGDTVEENHTVCIIEAMKLMNEITAKQRLEVVHILVENGEPVEFGQPLFAVRLLG